MGSSAQRLPEATYENLLKVPGNQIGQILAGELVVLPRPSGPHAVAASILGGDLSGPFHRGRGGPGGWWILFEPEIHLGAQVVVPDLAGWRRQRLPTYPRTPFVDQSPDWVCEILSDSTRGIDRVRKMPIYAAYQVQHAWLIDPDAQTLEVFSLNSGRWTLIATFEGAAQVQAAPFDEVVIELAALWDLGPG